MRLCLACQADQVDADWVCAVCGFEPPRQEGIPLFSKELAESAPGFSANLFPQLAALEAGHFWYRARNRLICWALQQYFPQAKSFLEVGCGTGYVLSGLREAFPHLQLAGSEIFPHGLHFAAERLPGTELWQMDARHLPFRDEFDVIGAFDVLEHIEEDEAVLAELYKAVRKSDGKSNAQAGILLTVPQHAFLWSQYDELAHHVRRYEAADLKAKVERAGFEVLRMTSFVASLLPPMWLVRTLQKGSQKELDERDEFKINPILNQVFEGILNLEVGLIQRGVNFPMGGSLLLVARAKG